MTQRHRRSNLFALAGLVTLLLTITAHAAQPGNLPAPRRLEGAWEVTVIVPNAPPITDYASFNRDGSLVNIDPDPNLSAGIGRWVRDLGDRYSVTFVHFLSDHGLPIGTLKVRSSMQLGDDTFSGPFQTDVILGGTLVQTICGTVEGRRMEVEPVEACP